MTTSTATTCVPEVEVIQTLNLHKAPVNEQVIETHRYKSDDEPSNGFSSYEFFLFKLHNDPLLGFAKPNFIWAAFVYRQTEANQ